MGNVSGSRQCRDVCICAETTEIKVWESRRDRGSGKGMWGIKWGGKGWVEQEEEMRRSSVRVEGRASQVSTFLSIFHQAG